MSRLPAGGSATLAIDFGPTVSPRVKAVAVNITAVQPGSAGYLTAWSGNGSQLAKLARA